MIKEVQRCNLLKWVGEILAVFRLYSIDPINNFHSEKFFLFKKFFEEKLVTYFGLTREENLFRLKF